MNQFVKIRSSQSGWVLFEVVISTAIIMILLSYTVPILIQSKDHSTVVQQRLLSLSWSEGFKDNVMAQWQSIVRNGCYSGAESIIEIGQFNSSQIPSRIKNKTLEKGSDWLKGGISGQCGSTQTINGNEFEFDSSCQWKTNQTVLFSHCEAEYQGWVSQVSGARITVQFNAIQPNSLGVWPSGALFRFEPYVWYVSKGKNGHAAFWRTPLRSGNSLELWSGVKKIAIYPMLDNDSDGVLDELSTEYGEYDRSKLNALWVEALVTFEDCTNAPSFPTSQYTTFRGDTWSYQSRCDSIIDFIVPLSVL
ncbi:type II secretion system protein [Marinomonas sp. 2405UD68-3]|uniref:type II secretion system protein n=1 Tax=Marinomonas sp. 2405UD68-3 TaxID=3391835 RepID=UPI0039C92108